MPIRVLPDKLTRMQHGSAISLTVTVWSLAVAPVLCRAGVLVHWCDAAEAECCASCDCEGASPCSHEEGCEKDPCSQPIPRLEIEQAVAQAGGFAAVAVPVEDPATGVQACALRVSLLDAHPPGTHLPFPDSDIPLLI